MSGVYRAGLVFELRGREGGEVQDWNVTEYKYEVLLHLYTPLQFRGKLCPLPQHVTHAAAILLYKTFG